MKRWKYGIGSAVAWLLFLGNLYAASDQTLEAQVIALAYPIGDIVTATVLVIALRRTRRADVGRMLILLGGLACTALADSAFAYMTANDTYGELGSVFDSGWFAGYLLIALAPLWPVKSSAVEAVEGPIGLWQLVLPWAAVQGIRRRSRSINRIRSKYASRRSTLATCGNCCRR